MYIIFESVNGGKDHENEELKLAFEISRINIVKESNIIKMQVYSIN